MMTAENLYQTLGVEADVSPDEIRRAYRALALQWHPDKAASRAEPGAEVRDADAKFKEIAHAFSVLSDPDRRRRYDATGLASVEDGGDSSFDDSGAGASASAASVLDILFASSRQPRDQPGDAEVIEVPMSLRELREGCIKRVEFEQPETCAQCAGAGMAPCRQCTVCAGKGRVAIMCIPGVQVALHVPSGGPCIACQGRGKQPSVGATRCAACAGSGVAYRRRGYDLRVPPGVADGHEEALPGRGPARARCKGGGSRDVVLRFTHAFEEAGVTVDGAGNVVARVALTLEEVLTGFDKPLRFSHLTHCVDVRAGAYRNPDEPFVVPGKGIHERAALVVCFHVVFPGENDRPGVHARLVRCRDVFRRALGGGR